LNNSFKLSYRINRTFGYVTGIVVDQDDNLILADKSFVLIYSGDGKSITESIVWETAWDVSYHKKFITNPGY
jgi:hypothetical protein